MANEPKNVSLKFEVDGEQYEFLSNEDMTLGEAAEVERYTGKSMAQMADDGMSVQSMIFQLYLSMRKKHPQTTLAQVEGLPMTVINDAITAVTDALNAPKKAARPKSSSQKTPAADGDQS